MIACLEEHIAAWAQSCFAELGLLSNLYQKVEVIPGTLALPSIDFEQSYLVLLVKVDKVAIHPEAISEGLNAISGNYALPLNAQVRLRIEGRAGPLDTAQFDEVTPSWAKPNGTDIAALTLLGLLREPTGPAPDIGSPDSEEKQKFFSQGNIFATHGDRSVKFQWNTPKVVDVSLTDLPEKRKRWEIYLDLSCLFIPSAVGTKVGKILKIQTEVKSLDEG